MRFRVGVRVLDTPEDVSRFNLETGWHYFARRYPTGQWSPSWWTTRDAARRGLSSAGSAELWGYDSKSKRWVRDAPFRAGRFV
jgi:hypothetical protein